MSKNILAENMRRFHTKNLKEALDTTELDNQLLALDDNDYEGFVNVMKQINDNGPIEEWLKKASQNLAKQFHKFQRKFKMKLDKLSDMKLKRAFEKSIDGYTKDGLPYKIGKPYMGGKEVPAGPLKRKPSTSVPKW